MTKRSASSLPPLAPPPSVRRRHELLLSFAPSLHRVRSAVAAVKDLRLRRVFSPASAAPAVDASPDPLAKPCEVSIDADGTSKSDDALDPALNKPRLAPCSRSRLVCDPRSLGYRRMLPFLMEIDKDDIHAGKNDPTKVEGNASENAPIKVEESAGGNVLTEVEENAGGNVPTKVEGNVAHELAVVENDCVENFPCKTTISEIGPLETSLSSIEAAQLSNLSELHILQGCVLNTEDTLDKAEVDSEHSLVKRDTLSFRNLDDEIDTTNYAGDCDNNSLRTDSNQEKLEKETPLDDLTLPPGSTSIPVQDQSLLSYETTCSDGRKGEIDLDDNTSIVPSKSCEISAFQQLGNNTIGTSSPPVTYDRQVHDALLIRDAARAAVADMSKSSGDSVLRPHHSGDVVVVSRGMVDGSAQFDHQEIMLGVHPSIAITDQLVSNKCPVIEVEKIKVEKSSPEPTDKNITDAEKLLDLQQSGSYSPPGLMPLSEYSEASDLSPADKQSPLDTKPQMRNTIIGSKASNSLEVVALHPMRKGILKRNLRVCKGVCPCLDCSAFRLHARRAYEFSRKQMNEADDIISRLTKELGTLRSVLENYIKFSNAQESSSALQVSQITAACTRATRAEAAAKEHVQQMFLDLHSHTKSPGHRVSFAESVDGRQVHPQRHS